MDKRYIVFAPHVDDEVIGCFTYLNTELVSDVFYFFEHSDPIRRQEAMNSAERFKFTPHFINEGGTIDIKDNVTIFVPNINDQHPHHKKVNRFAKQFVKHSSAELLFYSVDMNVKHEVLTMFSRENKKNALFSLFPSQVNLFEDAKYHLFESILKSDSNKMIWVKFQKEGIHCYPAALTDPNLEDVKFLGYDHRHLFNFKIAIEVFHNDRDIEFIQFKRWLEDLYNGALEFNHKSCEMLADDLSLKIQKRYPSRKLIIDVSEDDENGVSVEYPA